MHTTRRTFLSSAAALTGAALAPCGAWAQGAAGMAGVAYGGEHTRQIIDGFGFSEAFHQAGVMRLLSEEDQTSLLNLMFSNSGGMGYSILRNIIGEQGEHPDPKTGFVASIEPEKDKYNWTGDEDQIWLMNEAKKRGCTRFLSSCWSPPAWMKTNGNIYDGALKPAMYQTFADYLATYVLEYKKRYGLDIYTISPTNEPGYIPKEHYASCRWTGAELSKFLKENLIPTFAAQAVPAEIVIDEHNNWSPEFIDTILSDSTNDKGVHIVAAHAYADTKAPFMDIGLRTGQFQNAMSKGKRIWETEVSAGDAQIVNMNDGVYWARVLHTHLVEDNVSAWLYWWGAASSTQRSALISIDLQTKKYQLTKRFFTLGQYARFIRPGYHRVDATPTPAPHTYFSAYLSPDAKRMVCVAINDDAVERPITIQPGGFPVKTCIGIRTSNTETHAKLPAIEVKNGSVSVVTAPLSVTTYVLNA